MNRVLIPQSLDPKRLAIPAAGATVQTLQGETMGTTWLVRAVVAEKALPELQLGAQQLLDRVVSQMSHWLAESDLCVFNRSQAGTWIRLPKEFFEVLATAQAYAADSDGAFDPTIGALVDLWGFGPSGPRHAPPTAAEIDEARARVGWSRVRLDQTRQSALQPGGMRLDFSSIAKGYAVDQLAGFLQRSGVDHWMVEVGGELRGQGLKPDGQPWWIELEQLNDQFPRTLLALHGLSVASSGDYRRYFEYEGQRYAHTLDPRIGRPVTHALAAVTVIHAECMHADALATVLGVLAPEEALDYAGRRGVAARLVLRKGNVFEERMSPAFKALLDD